MDRRRRGALLAGIGLLGAACFEPPVLERLEMRFLANGAVVVASRVEVSEPEGGGANAALRRRLAEARRELLEGTDAWSARFGSVEPAAERSSWEKRLGELWRAERAAALAEPGQLARFFADTGLLVDYHVEGERAELTLSPGGATRANRRQRQQVERAMDGWTAAVARYLKAARALYDDAEERPDRARASLGALFREVIPEETGERLPALSLEEERRVKAVADAMQEVWAVLEVQAGESHSLDELSHLVYDPLPAPIYVKLPAAAQEVEGFEPGPDGTLTAEGPGLWTALRALEGRWISPDPLLLFVTHSAQAAAPLDLDAFLQTPRRATAPTPEEVRQEIETRLEPKSRYRAVWAIDPDSEEPFRWD